jgi:hypothetical protein
MVLVSSRCPSLRALRLHTSDQNERKNQCQDRLPDVMSYDVCVTTYEMLKVSAAQYKVCLYTEMTL